MHLLALLALAQTQGHALDEAAVWKRYQAKLEKAYMLDVRWTVTTKEPPETRKFKLLKLGTDKILLEEEFTSRTIWIKDRGLSLDLTKSQYTKLTEKPDFAAAEFLGIPGVCKPKGPNEASTQKELKQTYNGAEWSGIERLYWSFHGGWIEEYWFNPKTDLLWSFTKDRSYLSEENARITKFDLTPLLTSSDFPLEPPAGFREKGAS